MAYPVNPQLVDNSGFIKPYSAAKNEILICYLRLILTLTFGTEGSFVKSIRYFSPISFLQRIQNIYFFLEIENIMQKQPNISELAPFQVKK